MRALLAVLCQAEFIISPEVWDAVQDILGRHTKIKYCASGYDNVFRGLLFCPDCGRSK